MAQLTSCAVGASQTQCCTRFARAVVASARRRCSLYSGWRCGRGRAGHGVLATARELLRRPRALFAKACVEQSKCRAPWRSELDLGATHGAGDSDRAVDVTQAVHGHEQTHRDHPFAPPARSGSACRRRRARLDRARSRAAAKCCEKPGGRGSDGIALRDIGASGRVHARIGTLGHRGEAVGPRARPAAAQPANSRVAANQRARRAHLERCMRDSRGKREEAAAAAAQGACRLPGVCPAASDHRESRVMGALVRCASVNVERVGGARCGRTFTGARCAWRRTRAGCSSWNFGHQSGMKADRSQRGVKLST